jgi:hypothetical protein
MTTGVQATFGLSATISAALSFASLSPLFLSTTLITASDLGQLGYINAKYSNGIDSSTSSLTNANINNLFGQPNNLET